MNLFRLVADLLHLASVVILLVRILNTRKCRGISLKTQALYLVVFLTRYIDLFTTYISMYNTVMKIFFILSAVGIVYLMTVHPQISKEYRGNNDAFPVGFLLGPCFVLAFFVNDIYPRFTLSESVMEFLWTFSIYLEAVAILPQLFMIIRKKEKESFTWLYVAALGGYRALYLVNWSYRYLTEPYYRDWIVWMSGAIHTGALLVFVCVIAYLDTGVKERAEQISREDVPYEYSRTSVYPVRVHALEGEYVSQTE